MSIRKPAFHILSALKSYFPFSLLLLVFYSTILGVFLEPSLFEGRAIAINLAWLGLFMALVHFFKLKWLYKITVILFFVIGFVETSHWILLNGPLTVTSLLVLSNTYLEEVQEFSDSMMSIKYVLILPYIFIFYLALRHRPVFNKEKVHRIVLWVILVYGVGFISETVINGRLIRLGLPNTAKVACSFYNRISMFEKALSSKKPRELSDVKHIQKSKQQTCVVILGESNSRKRMSLYGAEVNTTPLLKQRDDLIVFTDVVSPWSTTIRSVLTILSETSLEKEVPILENKDIFDVFHSAGFKNYWISNQCPIGVWDNQITEFSKKADYNKFVNMSSNSSYEATYTASYDEKLIEPFIKVLNDESADKKLIVLHMIGNHMSYSKRYPSSFEIYSGDGSKVSNTQAEYNNSLRYVDFILDSLLSIVQTKYEKNEDHAVSVIYLSDHGENVYDVNNQVGHGYSKSAPKVNVDIPFFVWVSKGFRYFYPKSYEAIVNNAKKPFVTDHFFHALIDINNIRGACFDSTKSIFNAAFDEKRKRILCDGLDYDLK